MKLSRIFTHQLVLTPIMSYVGLVAMAYAGYSISVGAISAWWLVLAAVNSFLVLMGVTVGMHRLFCHRAFRVPRYWHLILAYLGTIGVYGSTVQWAAMHASHHRYYDTEKDPHYSGLWYLLWKRNNPTIFDRRVLIRLYRDPLHRFMHRYYTLVVLATALLFWLISPMALIFGYLIPVGWLHLASSFHHVFAHGKKGPRDLPLMELLMFTGGEWFHGHHHDRPKDPRFGSFDGGYLFIRLIQALSRWH
jgi:stearoyl-CoA desaturase (delta-9 desaturase)